MRLCEVISYVSRLLWPVQGTCACDMILSVMLARFLTL